MDNGLECNREIYEELIKLLKKLQIKDVAAGSPFASGILDLTKRGDKIAEKLPQKVQEALMEHKLVEVILPAMVEEMLDKFMASHNKGLRRVRPADFPEGDGGQYPQVQGAGNHLRPVHPLALPGPAHQRGIERPEKTGPPFHRQETLRQIREDGKIRHPLIRAAVGIMGFGNEGPQIKGSRGRSR